jgi:hypothetical protein
VDRSPEDRWRASPIRGGIWSVWHYPVVIVLLPKLRPDLPIMALVVWRKAA